MTADQPLSLWVVYDRPTDYPHGVIARRHAVPGGPTEDVVQGSHLDVLDWHFSRQGLHWWPRQPGDEPRIVGVWL